jgi:hypothetical protein
MRNENDRSPLSPQVWLGVLSTVSPNMLAVKQCDRDRAKDSVESMKNQRDRRPTTVLSNAVGYWLKSFSHYVMSRPFAAILHWKEDAYVLLITPSKLSSKSPIAHTKQE